MFIDKCFFEFESSPKGDSTLFFLSVSFVSFFSKSTFRVSTRRLRCHSFLDDRSRARERLTVYSTYIPASSNNRRTGCCPTQWRRFSFAIACCLNLIVWLAELYHHHCSCPPPIPFPRGKKEKKTRAKHRGHHYWPSTLYHDRQSELRTVPAPTHVGISIVGTGYPFLPRAS